MICFHSPAVLFIQQDPFPASITRGRDNECGNVKLRFFTCALPSFSVGPVECSTEMPDNSESARVIKAGGVVKWGKNVLLNKHSEAVFKPKFTQGSRKQFVSLQFTVKVQARQGMYSTETLVQSEFSSPFVVITNEAQWEESEGELIKADLFQEQPIIPWFRFANTLQQHFLSATRQAIGDPSRPLSLDTLTYFHQRFFNWNSHVNGEQYDRFWQWFGKALHKLRYKRHIAKLYISGLIYGFSSREQVNNILQGQKVGTFLLRFSERAAGQFAIAYVAETGINYYLVQRNDTNAAQKTLPDFLHQEKGLKTVATFVPQGNERSSTKFIPKDEAFGKYYSQQAEEIMIDGYVGSIRPSNN